MKSLIRTIIALAWFVSFAGFAGSVHADDQFIYTNSDIQSPNEVLPNKVQAFRVGADGSLSEIAGSPFMTGGSSGGGYYFASNRIVISAPGKFLYASNSLSNNVSAFSIDVSSGNLTPVPGSPFPLGSASPGLGGISLAVTPDGKFLMAGNPVSESITSFSIGADGSLTAVLGSPFFAGGRPIGMKVSPNGKFLAAGLLGSVAIFRIAPDGSLTSVQGSPFANGGIGFAAGVDINCKSSLLFAGEANALITIVDVFSIAFDGVLTPITGSPFVTDAGANSNVPLLSPDDRFLFVSNQEPKTFPSSEATVTVFSVAADGTLTLVPGSAFPVGGFPSGMATNRAGTLLFTAIEQAAIGVLSVANDGSLTPVPGSPFRDATLPFSLVTSLAAFPFKTCAIPVAIDIRPGDFPNGINLKSKGVVPVAILGSPTFSVVDVDTNTVKFAGASPDKFAYEDVNSDGITDLVLFFRTKDFQLSPNSTEATLTAELKNGESITGTDSVRIVP